MPDVSRVHPRSGGFARIALLAGVAIALAGSGVTLGEGPARHGAHRPAGAAFGPAAGPLPGKRLGFVVTYFWYAMYQGKDACPTGINHIPTSQEFLANKPPAERARLLQPQNAGELDRLYDQRGPKGENLCVAPWAVSDAAMTTLSGDRNDGLDLDGWKGRGAPPASVCRQKQYVGEDGSQGIDNQLGRIYACLGGIREKGTLIPYFTTAMRGGMWSMLVEVSGVQDTRNDPDVRVDIYAGAEPMVKDAAGNVLANASLSPRPEAKLHRQFPGHITNGVLETRVIDDMFVPDMMAKGRKPIQILQPRFKLTLLPDGTAKGLLGGYRTIDTVYEPGAGGIGQGYVGYLCEGMYHAVRRFADGHRDPKTGTCDQISAAFRIEAIPAFIVHPEDRPAPSFADAKP